MKISIVFCLLFSISCMQAGEKVNLIDSSFEELKTGYSGVYDPEEKTARCTKFSQATGEDEMQFSEVKMIGCCDQCTGKIIGTCKNPKYDPTIKAGDNQEPPFFFITTDQ